MEEHGQASSPLEVDRLCLQVGSYLDRVSTGSGSDLVSEQHAISKRFDFHGLPGRYRSLY
jgi:hypothetical protein